MKAEDQEALDGLLHSEGMHCQHCAKIRALFEKVAFRG